MQTFLPYRSYLESVRCLDYRRLGKQRVEAKQIHSIITGQAESNAWRNHPAVLMWQGNSATLAAYYNACVKEWIRRGYKNTMPLLLPVNYHIKPKWLTDSLCMSHRSNLLRKDVEYYGQFGWRVADDLPYLWPLQGVNNMRRLIMKPSIQETMLKVARGPGICSQKEIEDTFHWLEEFRKQLAIYKSVYGEPAGLSVDSAIDNLKYYIK